MSNNEIESESNIFEQHEKLIHWCVRKFARELVGTAGYDDAFQAGSVGLIRAIRSHDASRAFRPFATVAIIRAVQYEAKKISKHGITDVSAVEVAHLSEFDEVDDRPFQDSIFDHRVRFDRLVFDELIARLSEREAFILYQRYWIGRDGPDIADEQKISKQMIHAVEKRAIGKLRMILESGATE